MSDATINVLNVAKARPADDPWAPYLNANEEILWEGKPVPGFVVIKERLWQSLTGLFLLFIASFWIAASLQGTWAMKAIAVVLFGAAFYQLFGHWLWDRAKRDRTVYAHSAERCFIAINLFGRRLKSYPITREMEIDLKDDAIPSVYFSEEVYRRPSSRSGKMFTLPVGFERIKDGREVYRRLLDLQKSKS